MLCVEVLKLGFTLAHSWFDCMESTDFLKTQGGVRMGVGDMKRQQWVYGKQAYILMMCTRQAD